MTERAKRRRWPLQMVLRQLHIYLSLFVAPSLMFFALSGALQTFRIPDRADAPMALVKVARLHKDDVFAPKPVKAPRPAQPQAHGEPGAAIGKPRPPAAQSPPKPGPYTTALKWYFSIASVIMAITTALGIWMALAFGRRKGWMAATLLAGAAAPVVLVLLA